MVIMEILLTISIMSTEPNMQEVIADRHNITLVNGQEEEILVIGISVNQIRSTEAEEERSIEMTDVVITVLTNVVIKTAGLNVETPEATKPIKEMTAKMVDGINKHQNIYFKNLKNQLK